ncbi:MAG: hypothetical protein CMI63_18390 [Parvularcula sp.]|nr:hypothetical protein [Parvularcula sp.]
MANTKSATLTLRIDPDLKEALRTTAEKEHRSIANMIEVMIMNYCANKQDDDSDSDSTMRSGGGSK